MSKDKPSVSNVVIFGPAHCGKSTLAGFLKSRSFTLDGWEKKKRKLRSDLAADFDGAQKFAYLLDTSKDERRRKTGHLGTSHVMHTAKVELEMSDGCKSTWTIIDTPGSQHGERERVKGMYYGDVGIFMIEVSALLKLRHGLSAINDRKDDDSASKQVFITGIATEFLAPLFAWNRFEKSRQLIVALSKMDTAEYNETVFNQATEILCSMLLNQSSQLQVVPIAISVSDELSHNVLDCSDKMPWYSGYSLIQCIERKARHNAENAEASLGDMIVVDKDIHVPGVGEVIKGKVLRGVFSRGDAVQIGPLDSGGRSAIFAQAVLRDIKVNDHEVNFSREGDICTLKLAYSGKLSAHVLRTSVITRHGQSISSGSLLKLQVAAESVTCALLEQIDIVWFGKIVSCDVISMQESGDLFLRARGAILSMPIVDGELVFKTFFVKRGAADIYKYTLTSLATHAHVKFDVSSNSLGVESHDNNPSSSDALAVFELISRLKKAMADSGESLAVHQVKIVLLPPAG